MSYQWKKRAEICLLLCACAIAACLSSCGDVVQSETETRSGQPASVVTEKAPTICTDIITAEPEKHGQTESTAPAGHGTTATSLRQTTEKPPETEEKEISRIEKIPFETEYVSSDARYEDFWYVSVNGKSGLLRITEKSIYENGVIVRTETVETVIAEAEKRVITVGTKPIFTYETVTKKENAIAHGVEYICDEKLPDGERKIISSGKDGYTENTYKITYERGTEAKREIISSAVTEPETEIIAIGTKKKEETFAMPFRTAAQGGVDYRITQYYGGSNSHGGIDFGVYYGAPITASMSGTVICAYNDGYFSKSDLRRTYGTYVVIEHEGGYRTYYAHLKSKTVSVGDRVSQGDIIGYSGNTGRVSPSPTKSDPYAGTHLHFEIRKYISGSYVRVNPKNYLPYRN